MATNVEFLISSSVESVKMFEEKKRARTNEYTSSPALGKFIVSSSMACNEGMDRTEVYSLFYAEAPHWA